MNKWPFTEKMERAAQERLLVDKLDSAEIGLVYAATSQDKRVLELVAAFETLDERGKITLLRMAHVMPGRKGAD